MAMSTNNTQQEPTAPTVNPGAPAQDGRKALNDAKVEVLQFLVGLGFELKPLATALVANGKGHLELELEVAQNSFGLTKAVNAAKIAMAGQVAAAPMPTTVEAMRERMAMLRELGVLKHVVKTTTTTKDAEEEDHYR